ELLEIDRYALAVTARTQEEIAANYDRYQFHLVAQKLQAFCAEDLSAFFLDILKDRLYTCKADSLPRRAAQTALHHITHSLVRLMAPILTFTAEELWQVFTGKRDDSVFFQTWHALPRPHRKCERCWHYRPDVDDEALCGRCRSNLHGPGEKRLYA